MDTFAALIRLARQARDEERRALHAIDEALALVRDQLRDLRAAAVRERRAARQLPDGALRFAAYHGRVLARERSLHAELRRGESERGAQAERLAARHLELRRLEILAERRAARSRAERERQTQNAIEELILLRRSRGARLPRR